MEFSYTESTDTGTNMVTKDYSKSHMRENRTYGSVRGGQSNLIPSTRLTRPSAVRVMVGGCAASMYKTIQPPWRAKGKQANRAFGAWEMHPFCRLWRRLSTGKRLT